MDVVYTSFDPVSGNCWCHDDCYCMEGIGGDHGTHEAITLNSFITELPPSCETYFENFKEITPERTTWGIVADVGHCRGNLWEFLLAANSDECWAICSRKMEVVYTSYYTSTGNCICTDNCFCMDGIGSEKTSLATTLNSFVTELPIACSSNWGTTHGWCHSRSNVMTGIVQSPEECWRLCESRPGTIAINIDLEG